MTCGRHFCDSRQQRVHMSKFEPVAKAPVRIQQNILARRERRLLNWLCARLPAWATPAQLTTLGFAGAVLVAAGHLLSWFASEWPGLSLARNFLHRFGECRKRVGSVKSGAGSLEQGGRRT